MMAMMGGGPAFCQACLFRLGLLAVHETAVKQDRPEVCAAVLTLVKFYDECQEGGKMEAMIDAGGAIMEKLDEARKEADRERERIILQGQFDRGLPFPAIFPDHHWHLPPNIKEGSKGKPPMKNDGPEGGGVPFSSLPKDVQDFLRSAGLAEHMEGDGGEDSAS
jgi:hypothetical protein